MHGVDIFMRFQACTRRLSSESLNKLYTLSTAFGHWTFRTLIEYSIE